MIKRRIVLFVPKASGLSYAVWNENNTMFAGCTGRTGKYAETVQCWGSVLATVTEAVQFVSIYSKKRYGADGRRIALPSTAEYWRYGKYGAKEVLRHRSENTI
jgi:hypothetical protein